MITQLETSSCQTKYDVDGVKINLWVITGGTPAIAFDDWSFTNRNFTPLKKYANENWINNPCHFKHQNPNSIQGITYEDLPSGEQTIYNFVQENLPKKQLAEQRYKALSLHNIKSERKHDKENCTYVYAKLNLTPYYVSPVTFESGCYCGRCDDRIKLFNKWWQTSQKLFNPIFDSKIDGWHEITQTQYDLIKMQLEIYKKLYHRE